MITVWFLLAAIVAVTLFTLRRAQREYGRMPLDNLPVVFLLILALYTMLPPLFWLIQGGEYLSPLSGRIYFLAPTAAEQTYLTLLGLMVAVGVGASQWLVPRRYRAAAITSVKPVPQKVLIVCLAILILQFVLMNMLVFAGIIRRSESYVDSYRVIQELPLLLRQFIKILGGLSFFSKITVLVYLFQRWRTHKKWVYLFLLFTIFSTDPSGGRGGTFLMLFACLILWNRFVKNVSISQLAAVGLAGLVAFTALGVYRAFVGKGIENIGFLEVGFGEFDMLWANAIELNRERIAGQRLPGLLFFSELYGPIPSNFLPFEKTDYSTWYLNKYYIQYQAEGGGLMFGLLAQVAAGYGAVEAIIRGLVVGVFLGWLGRLLSRGTKWWHYPALLYCAVWTFQSIRDSSLALITPFVQIVIPAIIAVGVLASLLPLKRPAVHAALASSE